MALNPTIIRTPYSAVMDGARRLERISKRTFRIRAGKQATGTGERRFAPAPQTPQRSLPLSRFATALRRRSDCP
jgi:hypothetical protein